MGEWVRECSWYPNYHAHLFRRGHARFHNAVHEQVAFDGRAGVLREPLEHQSFRDVSHFLHKTDRYACISAHERAVSGDSPGVARALLAMLGAFARCFVYERGWRAGRRGFIISGMRAVAVLMEHAHLWEIEHEQATSLAPAMLDASALAAPLPEPEQRPVPSTR